MDWSLVTDPSERADLLGSEVDGPWDVYSIHGASKAVCRACGFTAGWSDKLTMREHYRRCPGWEQPALF